MSYLNHIHIFMIRTMHKRTHIHIQKHTHTLSHRRAHTLSHIHPHSHTHTKICYHSLPPVMTYLDMSRNIYGNKFIQHLPAPPFGDSLRPSDWLREKYSPLIGYGANALYFDWLS